MPPAQQQVAFSAADDLCILLQPTRLLYVDRRQQFTPQALALRFRFVVPRTDVGCVRREISSNQKCVVSVDTDTNKVIFFVHADRCRSLTV
eukprot:553660-Rhodomonas_salina.1